MNRALSGFTSTIFTEMSALATATGSVNLGQGFPDYDGPAGMLDAIALDVLDWAPQLTLAVAGVAWVATASGLVLLGVRSIRRRG